MSKLVPTFIRRFIYNRIEGALIQKKKEIESSITKVDLQQKHINNLKVLLNRNDLLALMPKGAVVAEIGVDSGNFSELILKITSPGKLHLVDIWGGTRYHDGLKTMIIEKFKKLIDAGTVEINVGLSTDMIPKFADGYFDWVYIDTDHSYGLTIKELNLVKSKMKPGGIIAGHDYTIGNWVGGVRYGVIEAVHEFCVKENWELIYLTMETDHYHSFAIRKL